MWVESVTNYAILDWGLQHSDHKATLFTLSIEHLCNGFIDYQFNPFTRNKIKIDMKDKDLIEDLKEIAEAWKSAIQQTQLPPSLFTQILSKQQIMELPDASKTSMALYKELKGLFVDKTNDYLTGRHSVKQRKVFYTEEAGIAKRKLNWLKEYRELLAVMRTCQQRNSRLSPRQRHRVQSVWRRFRPNNELPTFLNPNYRTWGSMSLEEWQSCIKVLHDLQHKWQNDLNICLLESKRLYWEKKKEKESSYTAQRLERRRAVFPWKYRFKELPAIMKSKDDPTTILTGRDVNESWGKHIHEISLDKMPREPDTEQPPWLQEDLWLEAKNTFAPHMLELMKLADMQETEAFLKRAGNKAPGVDKIQTDVIRFYLYTLPLDLHIPFINFINIILSAHRFPSDIKRTLIIFIHKTGDVLDHGNYRGISLLSCMYKVITGLLAARLNSLISEFDILETNQGSARN
jgi:hypothetical protein